MAKAKRSMTDQHKAALAEGRAEGRAVKAYLEALDTNRPKRGRKRTPDSITKRLGVIESELADASPILRLQLIQERMDLGKELALLGTKIDMTDVESAFVKSAGTYASRKGISYAAWRELGVPADVLKRAGITR
jgi:hypothetical protein